MRMLGLLSSLALANTDDVGKNESAEERGHRGKHGVSPDREFIETADGAHPLVVFAPLLLHDAHAEEVAVEAGAGGEVAHEEVDLPHGLRRRRHQGRHLPEVSARVLHSGNTLVKPHPATLYTSLHPSLHYGGATRVHDVKRHSFCLALMAPAGTAEEGGRRMEAW